MSTVTTTTSWGSRVGSSFKGMLTGLIFVVGAVCVLFWNEGRTIKRTKALEEAGKTAVSVDPQTLDPAYEDKLIHISGDVKTDDVLSDSEFNVSLNALKLQRTVTMYQWQENTETSTRRTSGGGEETTTTYSYSKVWSDELIDSSSFHDSGHDNPGSMPYESKTFLAPNATLGAFALSQDQVDNLGPSAEYNVNAPPTEKSPEPQAPASGDEGSAYRPAAVNEGFAQDFSVSTNDSADSLSFSIDSAANEAEAPAPAPASAVALDSRLKPYGSGYCIGDPSNPQIGDVRIVFSYVATPCPTSFVAQQHGNSLVEYQAKTGKVLLQNEGIHTLEEMIAIAQQNNKMFAWIIRAVGLFVIFLGIKALCAPLETLVDIIPFAGTIVGFGTGIVAFCGTLFLGLGAISIGWIYYRPLIGIPLLIVAVAALFYPIIRGKKKAKEATVV